MVTVLYGCITSSPMVSMAPEMASTAFQMQKDKFKDIEIVLGKDVSVDDIKKQNTFAFLVASEGNNYFAPGAGQVFADNLTKEFIKLGFRIVDRDNIENVINEVKFQRGVFADNKRIAKIGRMIGVSGIFKGSIQSGQDFNTGFAGIGAGMKNGIVNASLKLIDVETTKVTLIVTADYKSPKSPTTVAEEITAAFQHKIYGKTQGK